jgi:RND superfamily putative drug exporter
VDVIGQRLLAGAEARPCLLIPLVASIMNLLAVGAALGQAGTGRVITAAAAIMILVFASFALGPSIIIKQFGLGLAGAIIIDAFIIRTVVVPSLMHLFGNANWWLPRWLDRAIPHLNVEGSPSHPRTRTRTRRARYRPAGTGR